MCDLCSETIVWPDHEISEKHSKNEVLYEYSLNRKLFAGNRKGAVVTCNVSSSFSKLSSCADPKIKISTKPDEEVKFNFIISNESKKGKINIIYIQIPHNKLNFTMNDHNVGFGCGPFTLNPKTIFPKEIYVKFKTINVGQYEMPIIFSFYKLSTNEKIIIMRDMVVYVEQKLTIHEIIDSPYTRKPIMADKLIKTTAKRNIGDNMFRVPKNYKLVYANNLQVQENSPEVYKKLVSDIRDIFAIGITPDNYVRYFHNLLWFEETIIKIHLKKYNMSGVKLLARANSDSFGLFVPGLGEKRPSVMLGDLIYIKPQATKEYLFEAVIDEIKENYVNINGLDARFLDYHTSVALFDIRFSMSRLSLERMHQAVHNVRGGRHNCRIFPNRTKPRGKLVPIQNFYNLDVGANPEQRQAVEHILAGSAGVAPFLLHGPPGTGKTVTVVEAVLQVVNSNPKTRVLVCTDSNMAADHVATYLVKYKHMFATKSLFLRASSKYRVWETLPECLHKYSNGTSYRTFENVSIKMFCSFRIVVTTLSHAAKFAKQFQLQSLDAPITHLFIDEAAQSSEPACLIPIVGLLHARGSLVLAGDPMQLGPVIISHSAKAMGLGLSLMERLTNTCPLYNDESRNPRYTVMLLNNFRSDLDILQIPNQLFYKGQLKPMAKEDKISRTDILGDKPGSRAIVFHGVLSKEQRMGQSPSYYNIMEIEIVQLYVERLVHTHKVRPEDIGIVAPYIRQAYKIKAWLVKNGLSKLEVGTVEAFQGKEKRVIIVSTVRANCALLDYDAKFQLGFLVDDKRFNVALTRAKAKVIIIGNPLCLQKDVKWLTYMEQCRRFGTYLGFDASTVQSEVTQKELLNRITPMLKDLKERMENAAITTSKPPKETKESKTE